MTLTRLFGTALAVLLMTTAPVLAGEMMIKDSYVRSSTPNSPTGAAFFVLMNNTDSDDRLIGAASDVAERVEMHSHTEDANGVMRMGEIDGGVPVAAGDMHAFARGGDHVMFMGLTAPLVQGEQIAVTLTFEKAGDVQVMIPVDHARKPDQGAKH